MSTTQTSTHIEAAVHMNHGHLALSAKPIGDIVVVDGSLPDFYSLVSIHLDPTAARALAEQLVAAADAVEGHWQPDTPEEPTR